jgi:hypothetical protein
MTFALFCHNKRSKTAAKPLSLVLGYAMEVAVDLGDIVRTTEFDFTDEREFGNWIRALGA